MQVLIGKIRDIFPDLSMKTQKWGTWGAPIIPTLENLIIHYYFRFPYR